MSRRYGRRLQLPIWGKQIADRNYDERKAQAFDDAKLARLQRADRFETCRQCKCARGALEFSDGRDVCDWCLGG